MSWANGFTTGTGQRCCELRETYDIADRQALLLVRLRVSDVVGLRGLRRARVSDAVRLAARGSRLAARGSWGRHGIDSPLVGELKTLSHVFSLKSLFGFDFPVMRSEPSRLIRYWALERRSIDEGVRR